MNSCAIRLSRALNYSGITIPFIQNKTKLGADGKYYFTFASDANNWMKKTFGTNTTVGIGPNNSSHFNYKSCEILPKLTTSDNPLLGKKGIFSMVSSDSSWSSGHCDLLYPNSSCLNNCHFEGPILYIDVWELN